MQVIQSFFLSLYRFKPLRFLMVFVVAIFFLYVGLAYTLAPSFISKTIKQQYLYATGHQLEVGSVSLDPFAFTLSIKDLKDSADLWSLQHIFIDLDLQQSLKQSALVVNSIDSKKLTIKSQQFASGQWNFDDIVKHAAAINKKSPADEHKQKQDVVPLVIKKLMFNDAAIYSNVRELNNASLAITPLNIAVENIDFRNKKSASLSINAVVNKTIPVKIDGSFAVQALDAELNLDINSLPVVWFGSMLKPYAALDVLDGFIEAKSHIIVRAGVFERTVSNGQLRDLKLRPHNIEQDVITLKSLVWNDLAINLNEKTIAAPLLSVNQFDGQFIIYKNRTTNLQSILLKPAETKAVSANSRIINSDQQWQFNIERVAINNAALGFYDQSLTPSFRVIVQQFTGDLLHLTNNPAQAVSINLLGNVDGTAPVKLSGQVKPFMGVPQLDVMFSFEKMDMGAFTPYSSEYAGWRIKKGLMSVDLHYQYENKKIIGKNHVVIDHLEFGEKVRSPQLIDIPLRLGLALLTDENGVAVIDADINGDPQSPQFNLNAILLKALKNTFKKIITAPFRFLSNLVGSHEDLGRVAFVAGDSQLTPETMNKLTLLQQALKKRPLMRINIQGRYNAETDLAALQDEQVKSTLQKRGVNVNTIKSRDVEWAKAVTDLYKEQGLSNISASVDVQYQELVKQQIVTQERLTTLAHERSLAVKQYFVLTLGVESERLLLESDAQCETKNGCSVSEVVFSLEH